MKFPRLLIPLCLLAVCFVLCSASPALAGNDDWKPITPADLALKTPIVEKDADAEAIFWEVRVADELDGDEPRTVLSHYVRIKIFTERGRESQSKIDLPFPSSFKITDIAGRTIKADGTIIELKKSDVFERTIVKASGLKIKAKTFAMPSVEPGAIIEYKWREVRQGQLAYYIRLQFQRDVPVQLVKYYIKPIDLPGFPFTMRVKTFHGENTAFVDEKGGFHSTTMSNVPAFREEPRMPPEDQVRPWMLVYYSENRKLPAEIFWKVKGKETYDEIKPFVKVNDEVKKAAAAAIGDATTEDQKIERLFEFCRTKIKNTNDDASGMTSEQRAKLKSNKTPSDTLKRGMGTGTDIDLLFMALANAAGLDARFAGLADRGDTFFDPSFADDYFLRTFDIAIRVGDSWRFYDPANTYVPFGMLRWQEEGEQALVSDPKDPTWVPTPLSPPEKSKQKRTAKLSLSEDGTLEGDVRIEYTGHFAVERKEYDDDDSPAEREATLRNSVKEQMSTAEVTNIGIENVTDPVKPYICTYHVRVPAYAQRTGKRLFLQPAFFQRGVAPLFVASERRNSIYFKYPWSEQDEVTIELPAGFTLDNADTPQPISAKDTSDYKVNIGVTKDGKTLVYTRNFFFNGMIYPISAYNPLKQFFDMISKADNHTITLKQAATTAAN